MNNKYYLEMLESILQSPKYIIDKKEYDIFMDAIDSEIEVINEYDVDEEGLTALKNLKEKLIELGKAHLSEQFLI